MNKKGGKDLKCDHVQRAVESFYVALENRIRTNSKHFK